MSNMNINDLPLPYGWIKEIHQDSGHPYYVDTKANPPRSIWTHPYEDEQYLQEHPEAREKVRPPQIGERNNASHDQGMARRHSYTGAPSGSQLQGGSQKPKRGLFGKLKDKAIGMKEEREQMKRAQMMAQEERRQQLAARRATYGGGYGQPQYMGGPYNQYGPPPGMHPGGGYGYAPGGGRRMGGGGMGGMAMPLMGGMAGGLLLGSALGGMGDDWGHDGGFSDGGGDFGGGDFGGGFD
ncbi:hypothetical protein PQX77_008217 [Marasmius sp. AFHP31]|nr:hypothetical protein PQX77_008276 [Marasmius sp. AFHP31]KAK1228723.1 hypothetical protein PQX77_008217 [Marasmius sp. AFHP31]